MNSSLPPDVVVIPGKAVSHVEPLTVLGAADDPRRRAPNAGAKGAATAVGVCACCTARAAAIAAIALLLLMGGGIAGAYFGGFSSGQDSCPVCPSGEAGSRCPESEPESEPEPNGGRR